MRRVAKKVWNRCCVSREPPQCVPPNKSRTNHDDVVCRIEKWPDLFRRHASHLDEARCDAETIRGHGPNCWLVRSRSTTRSCAGCSCRRIRRATRTSRESYSYRASPPPEFPTCKYRCRLASETGINSMCGNTQVTASVAQDDHCQVSRRRDLWLRHRINAQNPRATNRVRRWIQDLTFAGDELAVGQFADVDLRLRTQR